jgi:hypothetical protein
VTPHAFAFRAPWYVREREHIGLRDPGALRPAIQMYDSPRFVKQVTNDPRDSLAFTPDDLWSFPVPVAFPGPGPGRTRFATFRMVSTGLRKLYQPNHDRFYLVVAELFCDEPGLPRAGPHRDITVKFAMRRRHLVVSGGRSSVRRLARELMRDLIRHQHADVRLAARSAAVTPDVDDLWWADQAARERFTEDHADLLDAVTAHLDSQSWLVDSTTGAGRWGDLADQTATEAEQMFPMWRLPDRPDTCAAANTRSLWFGLVPTYSADHWVDPDPAAGGRPVPKLDDHAIYEIVCSVTQPPPAGQEQCPPKVSWSTPTEPFRLAAAYDPDGTKNRNVSISAPDFRALAARAGQAAGPGGLAISTPPGSQMQFNPFNGIPKPGDGSMGGTGSVCTFAFELFFIVALFLFLMFMPIVVFVFQLWWMLALRFCLLKLSAQFTALATFFAGAHVNATFFADLEADANAGPALDAILGVAPPPPNPPTNPPNPPVAPLALAASPDFKNDPPLTVDLVSAVDPALAAPPTPPPTETKPDDPLCR